MELVVFRQLHADWGDWSHFIKYARETMVVLPSDWGPLLAFTATTGGDVFGLILLFGSVISRVLMHGD